MAAVRSARQAASRPAALAGVTAVHGAVLAASGGRGRMWVVMSWALAATHLGLLEARRGISAADVISLARANLPVAGRALGRWLGVVALVSDVLDGRLARRRGTTTPFGAAVDSLADAAFWTWLVLRHEPASRVRAAAFVAWAGPVAAVAAASVARGRMVDVPRPVMLRPAAAMQALIALRHLRRRGPGARAGARDGVRAAVASRR